jgi:preprotein translocase subunit SecF
MTIVVLDIMKVQLSTAGIVALLMLIGYSVDVDILLTSRVVRSKEGTLNERIFGAFKTGITMTLTVIAATGMALIFMHSTSPVLSQMFTIILIGLGFDIFNCWITNASILKWYMEAKGTV